jgi:hypothetical protein
MSDLPDDLKAIQERAEKALGGEWRVYGPGTLWLGRQPLLLHYPRKWYSGSEQHDLPLVRLEQRKANAEFIAHAREDIPKLLTALAEAEGKLESLLSYTQHNFNCMVVQAKPPARCTCGLDAILGGKSE